MEHHDKRRNTVLMNVMRVGLVVPAAAQPTTSLAGGFTDFTAAEAFAEALAMAEEADADLRGAGPHPQHAICYLIT